MSNEKARKDRDDAIRFLLRTTEELKTAVSPLIRDKEDVYRILKSHEEAITGVMENLMGTKEEHEKRLSELELVRTSVSKLEKERETHEEIHGVLEKRLKRIEYEPIVQILKKTKEKKVAVSDLKVVDEILSLHPDDAYLFKVKILVLERIGEEQELLDFIEEAISKYPEDAWLWHRKGGSVKDFDESLKCFDKALELLKDDSSYGQHNVWYSRASLLAMAKRFEESLDSSSKSVEANPNCPVGWTQKGKILVELARIPEAVGCFDKAIELEKDYAEAWLEKGIALCALGPDYFDEALACFNKTIKLDSKSAIAYFNKGKILSSRNQDKEALQSFEKGLEFDAKNPCAWCDRGILLNVLKRNEEALKSFERALELCPPKECNVIFINKAIVLWYLGRYKEGVELAEKTIEAEPGRAVFWDVLACNLKGLGKDEKALEAFEKASSLKKRDEDISWDELARLYEKMGRTREAKLAQQKYESLKKKAKKSKNAEK